MQDEGYDAASERLDRAIARLEASVRSLNGRMRTLDRIESDVKQVITDRAKLSAELDRTRARAKKLDDSAAEVSRRLVTAMETVKTVLTDG
jgi:ABC-type transporter Mla subunit MlaD